MCWASNHQNNYRNGPRAYFPFNLPLFGDLCQHIKKQQKSATLNTKFTQLRFGIFGLILPSPPRLGFRGHGCEFGGAPAMASAAGGPARLTVIRMAGWWRGRRTRGRGSSDGRPRLVGAYRYGWGNPCHWVGCEGVGLDLDPDPWI
jgi:hypothetical protein